VYGLREGKHALSKVLLERLVGNGFIEHYMRRRATLAYVQTQIKLGKLYGEVLQLTSSMKLSYIQ